MKVPTLEDVSKFAVPAEVVETTEQSLRHAGEVGYELFVLWSGVCRGAVFEVQVAHVPHQTSYRLQTGLCVRVEGDALHKLNAWLFDSGQILGAQVHAHPTDAYHSETDDSFPIVTMLGGLSLVVPDFCRLDLFRGSVAYRLGPYGWVEDQADADDLVKVV